MFMYGPEESIYNIVKEVPVKPEKPPRYVSKHSGKVAPTGSTFNLAQTTRPGVSNLAGEQDATDFGYKYPGEKRYWGPAPARSMPDPMEYLKASTHAKPVATLKQIKQDMPDKLKPSKLKDKLKPALPSKDDKPIMNLVTSKNFIVANAVENILAAPKKVPNDEKDFLNKEDFGKVPAYLNKIKSDIESEYQYIRDLKEAEVERETVKRPLNAEERLALLQGLKAKWEEVNTDYQLGTHITKLDTVGKIKKKERHESTLTQIEKDIEKIKRDTILVDPSY